MKHSAPFNKIVCGTLAFLATASTIYALIPFELLAQAQQSISQTQVAQVSKTLISSPSAASNVQELQTKINERNKIIEQLNKEIRQYQELADKTGKEAQTLQKSIKQLEANGKALDLDIRRIREQIDAASLDITKLTIVINESEESIKRYKEAIAENIRRIHERDTMSMLEVFLSDKSMATLVTEVDEFFQVNKELQKLNVELAKERIKYEQSKKSEQYKKEELVKLQVELASKKKIIEYNKGEQQKILTATKNEEKTYQQLIKEKQATKAAFEKELFEYESQLKYTLDPSKLPPTGSSALMWPLDKVIITQRFGKTVASKRLYLSGSHNGVDFGARIGTPVKAMASGTVLGAGDTDIACPGASFGRWILVRFDNGLAATYAHLSVINVQQGQSVMAGDIIGYTGNTGYSTGPHLHISAYAANAVTVQNRPSASCGGRVYTMPIAPTEAYLDPMLYLPR